MTSLHTKWLQFGSLIGFLICAGIFFSWHWVNKLLPNLPLESLIGVWIACTYGLLVYVSAKLSDISAALGDLRHLPLSEAIRTAISRKAHFHHLRVLAVTSAKIHPIIDGSRVTFGECTLLLPFFDNAPPGSREQLNNDRVLVHLQEWKTLAQKGRIKTLKAYKTAYWPTFYCCLFDEHALLSGLYTYAQARPHDPLAVDYSEPFLITPGSANHTRMIAQYQTWFDESVAQAKPLA